ncbi:hypothetical protein G7074_25755 [Pedobacter sp. HDW13]|uniref:hypothetical protein n=1 Tax=Pedobacter sp. HDW13 TaxID=2714940 RepID=UPI00140A8A60|nr:hypothetical protein [Pedobacter sp. HDW13]QIL42364.1 hypothetical protein G7074_25755 [Pedobacter sp. HDW13]
MSLLAGHVIAGFQDGAGGNARFAAPMGLAINDKGEIFVADKNNSALRKISSSGVVSKVTGDLKRPSIVAVDKTGNIYCNDLSSSYLYKLNPGGVILELANAWGTSGNGWFWYNPSGIIVDAKGYIYVADTDNHTICKSVNEGMYFSLLAGRRGYGNFSLSGNSNGTADVATFNRPKGIVMDGVGNIFVADSDNHLIRKISPTGMVTTIAGSGVAGYADGVALAARFNHPSGLALNSDGTALYVTDQDNNLVRKIVLDK